MKLSKYAETIGISYDTALRWFKAGKIKGYRAHTGTIIVTESMPDAATSSQPETGKVAIYTRVSAAENKSNLESQAQRLLDYCAAKGYQVSVVIKEIGSGVNDSRPKLIKLITDPSISLIVVEHCEAHRK